MNLVEFLQDLAIKGWKIWNEDNRLGYRAPKEESTALVLAELKQHKSEILQPEPEKSISLIEHPELGKLLKTGEWGRFRGDGSLELLGKAHRIVTFKGQRINLQRIEQALLTVVEDCHVMERHQELVAYVVKDGSLAQEFLHNLLKSQLPGYPLPCIYVPVSALPLTNLGEVDEVGLASIGVIDSELIQSWEEQINSYSEIDQVAVVVQPNVKRIPLIHLEELLPSTQVVFNQVDTQVKAPRYVGSENNSYPLEKNLPAISHGEALLFPESAPQTLGEMLQKTASKFPHQRIIYINSDGWEQVQSYSQLLEDAQRILGGLRKLGLKPQDKVIFQLEQNQDFISAFWGCVLGGFIPVPVGIPVRYDQPNATLNKLQNSWQMLERPLVLTNNKSFPELSNWSKNRNLDNFNLESIESLRKFSPDNNYYNPQPEGLAILLLTSGSTGTPKAVKQSHQSLLSRCAGTTAMNSFTTEDISLNWFPLDHVGGIVMFHLRDVYLGCQQIHAPTQMVLQTPTLWLDWISKYRVTITWAPNFAYGLIVEQLEKFNQNPVVQADHKWDLSSLRFLLNGGEAIVAKTTRRFLELLTPYQLSSQAMHPAWGMSETSSGVTFAKNFWLKLTTDEQKFVELGSPIPGCSIRIVDDQNQVIEEGKTGFLQVRGASVTSGYYQNPEANKEAFTEDGWFDTGDLGFIQGGCLTITGRNKDVIIINGLNYYSHEIEAAVEELSSVEVSYTAACGVSVAGNNRESLAIFFTPCVSNQNQLSELLKNIRQQVVNKCGVNPSYLIPTDKEIIPKTSIGKIQRALLKQRFLDGEFKSLLKQVDLLLGNGGLKRDEETKPRNQIEKQLVEIFQEVLNLPSVGIYDNFFELGGHSLLATQLISRLRLTFEVEIPLRAVFSSPTVAQLDQTLTQLRTTKSGLTLPPIQPREADREKFPLSWAQEGLWFLNQLEGASATYNMPGAIQLSGNLDINALQQALSAIVRRHEVLRTSFQTVNGTPIQVIHPEATLNIKVMDLQQHSATERETVLHQQVQTEAITPFDLEIAPLIRCSLWQLDTKEYVLLLTMHHIVSDGWSMGVFIKELSSLYQAFTQGEPSPLPELPIQYTDFAVWQRQWLSGEVLLSQLNYWQQQLAGAPELLQLPTERPRPSVQTHRGATQNFSLNTDLTEKLQILSRESGTTLFMTLQAAFATLLYRYSGQSDILIGSASANRHRSEIESLIGFFVNTLVLRTRFEDNPSFEKLLARVRETTLKAYEHQDVPFEQVVEALQPQRSLSHSPLFQVMFVLQNAPIGELELPGVTWSQLEGESTIAKFDLTLSMSETPQGLVGSWEYNTDLFDGSTIERMASHFQNLLSAIVENPQRAVAELPLLSEAERHQLLREWNDTATEYPSDKCIHQLFEEQVEKTPLSVAVVFEKEQLTYQQLNQRANQLAHHLKSLGVEPEVLVGICVERSVEMVVGLLGILKAGGAYVPLDPSYPNERLSYMLADSAVEVLLTQSSLLSSLPEHQAQVVCLDSDWQAIEQHSQDNLDVGVGSDNLAYVIYTSGSTGVPKGVLVAHQGLLNLVFWHQATFAITSSDLATQLAGTAFDASAWELWPYLSAGASIHLLKTETIAQPKVLQDWLISQKITITFVPTPLLESFLSLEWPSSMALRIVLTGGDKLHQSPSTSLPFSLINNYGPTENTVVTTSGLIVSTEQTNLFPPPIGRPIANTQIYILDKHLQPVPIGVPGELYIGGDGLARGYLKRPELTQEKFIPNPFSNSKSERLYKTGDLARYLPEGNIEFLGRIDHQVKVRGFRIELGEIEAVLHTHPQIQQAVVIATEELPGNKRLVAYVVTRNESLSTHQLREFLKQKLPEYMVPSAFVTLDALPLTPNGKVDRFALPAPDGEITREQEYVAPRTPSEEIIANIFAKVLSVPNVGICDNFFELGGHSLLAVRLLSEIQQQFQKNFPLAILFQNPTIEQLASLLGSSVNTPHSILVPLKTSGNQPPLFCIHPVGGNVQCYADLARYLDKDYPIYGLQSLGLDGQKQPLTNLEEMAFHYIEAIQQIQPQGPYNLIGWSMGGVIAYEMAQQLQAKNEPVALLTLIDTYSPTVIALTSEIDEAMIVNQLAQDWGSLYGQELDISLETLRKIEPDQQLKHLFEQAKQQAIFPPEIEIEQMLSLWSVFQANIIAYYHYQPKSYPDSMLLLNASETPPEVIEDPTHGWGSLVLDDIQTYTITGDHYTIMKAPQIKCLAEKLNNHLNINHIHLET